MIDKMLKRMTKICVVLTWVILFGAQTTFAQELNLKVNVVERKPTDTINDFDFSSVNINSADEVGQLDAGEVKGVSTVASEKKGWFTQFIVSIKDFFLNIF